MRARDRPARAAQTPDTAAWGYARALRAEGARQRPTARRGHLRARLQHVLEAHRRVRQLRLERVDDAARVVGLLIGPPLLAPRLRLVRLQLGQLAVELRDVLLDDQRQLVDLVRLARLLKERARLRELRQLAQLLCASHRRAVQAGASAAQ
eukprot:5106921-Prymnesium_polylepis.1